MLRQIAVLAAGFGSVISRFLARDLIFEGGGVQGASAADGAVGPIVGVLTEDGVALDENHAAREALGFRTGWSWDWLAVRGRRRAIGEGEDGEAAVG